MLNSKELIERTGISRATLNNYISWGIVPKPEVLPPEPQDGAAPRIGYFPDEIAQRILEIQRLKSEGWSMARIAEHFSGGPAAAKAGDQSRQAGVVAPAPPAPVVRAGPTHGALPRLSIDEIPHPAYLVNHSFELQWFNSAAGAGVLRTARHAESGVQPSNLFACLFDGQLDDSREQILRFHLELARQRGAPWSGIRRDLSAADTTVLERIYHEAARPAPALVCHVTLAAGHGARAVSLYAVQFREGTLFVYVAAGEPAADELSTLLSGGELAPGDALRHRPPVLTEVAVLVTDLQDSSRIWSELPPEEYFELINRIWMAADPIFRRHHGTHGKHAGDGMVCYFFPRRDGSHVWHALLAAHELRQAMRRVTTEWQLRKGWATELCMNTGVDEGQQWRGTLRSGPEVEFTNLGETLKHAGRISDFARGGAIWATKNLVAKLSKDEKLRLKHGVRRRHGDGREVFVPSVFSTIERLAEATGGAGERFREIARLPITEIVDIADHERRREREPDQN